MFPLGAKHSISRTMGELGGLPFDKFEYPEEYFVSLDFVRLQRKDLGSFQQVETVPCEKRNRSFWIDAGTHSPVLFP